MASNAIHEMISAFAAGCMDRKNHKTFREYVEDGGDMPVGELGELQNVISLLPVILELENPKPELKDKVAKRLISLQDDIKDKIKATKQSTKTAAKTVISSVDEDEELKFTPVPEPTLVEDVPPRPTSPKTRGTEFYETAKSVNPPLPTQTYDLPPRTINDLRDSNISNSIKYLWFALLLAFVVLTAGLIIVYLSPQEYSGKITELEGRINSLNEEVASTRELVVRFDDLIQFMTYEDIKIIHLNPTDNTATGYGKLMLSFIHREGLLELKNMPTLGSDQAFQIWLISDGRSYSIGSYVPSRAQRYISISDLPYLPNNIIEMVRVTIEPLTGSEIPQGPAVLYGSLNEVPPAATPRRR